MGTWGKDKSCQVASLLQDPLAIITSGDTGTRKAIMTELLQLGCNVVTSSCSFDELKSITDELKASLSPTNQAQVNPIKHNICKKEEVFYFSVAFITT
uniref:Uncharacterized protein n=1 Tax=Neovison vison TaxID=452646 RepID=A0A8C7BXJ6_NEOVI